MVDGWKTILASALALIFSVLQYVGFAVPADEQAALQTGALAIAMFILRLVTSKPAGIVRLLKKDSSA